MAIEHPQKTLRFGKVRRRQEAKRRKAVATQAKAFAQDLMRQYDCGDPDCPVHGAEAQLPSVDKPSLH